MGYIVKNIVTAINIQLKTKNLTCMILQQNKTNSSQTRSHIYLIQAGNQCKPCSQIKCLINLQNYKSS